MCTYIHIYIYIHTYILINIIIIKIVYGMSFYFMPICHIVYIYHITSYHVIVNSTYAVGAGERYVTANLPTNIVDFRGFDSSIIFNLRCGILRPIGDLSESLSQAMLVGCNVSREIGCMSSYVVPISHITCLYRIILYHVIVYYTYLLYIYIHIHTYTYIYICICVCITYIYIYIYTMHNIYIYIYIYIHIYTLYIYTCIPLSLSIYIYIYIYTVGFHNFNLRIFNLRVSNPNKSIVDVFFTRCRISMCQGLGPTKHDEISEIGRIYIYIYIYTFIKSGAQQWRGANKHAESKPAVRPPAQ